MRSPSHRVSELGHLALRPPGIVALGILITDIIIALIITGGGVAILLIAVAVLAGLVIGWCIGGRANR